MTIYLFIGQDNIALDKDYLMFKQNYQTTESIEPFNSANLENKIANLGFFPEKKLFVSTNVFLNRVRMGKVSAVLEADLKQLPLFLGDHDFLFIEPDDKKLKYYQQFFPNLKIKQYKINAYLFSFLDSFVPKNQPQCFSLWQKTVAQNSAELSLFMLRRRVRELLLTSTDSLSGRYQSWQLAKLKTQLQKWPLSRLKHLYQSFYNYEKGLKTGNNPLKASQFVETVLALYL